MLIAESVSEKDLFAAATQFYVRLRRVDGRIIDVQYMIQNTEYAEHVLGYAKDIVDADLQRHLQRLNDLYTPISTVHEEEVLTSSETLASVQQVDKANWFLG